ncbi:MAG TPA: hypothetical protein VFV72_10695 [Candidatus Limnocylindrales bacterium]|nr:hypothetical protein [Candidatus Limnocylindrales bacterium]
MKVEGITWHAVVLETEPFAAMHKLLTDSMGLSPRIEMEGWSLFGMPNGSIIDLYSPDAALATCPWGLNEGVVFGFRVDDIHGASEELEAAGYELLGGVNFIEQLNYSWRHFRAPDGRVYGINQQH